MLAARAHPVKPNSAAPPDKTGHPGDPSAATALNPTWARLALGIQPKLTISGQDDPYEREADAVADQVMRMAEPASIGAAPIAIQRKCSACEDEQNRTIQTKRANSERANAALNPRAAVRAAGRGGAPLPKDLRSYFEPRLGFDFSSVRVHADGEAATAARAVQARAYTIGNDIVFGPGEYAPATAEGKRLMAHELAHVVQQHGRGRSLGGPSPSVDLRATGTWMQRVVDPRYVVDEPRVGQTAAGAPARVFFGRNSAAIPLAEQSKIDAFKSGPDRMVDLTLLGLATEDELAAIPNLPTDRTNAVAAALATPRPGPPPFGTAHAGARAVTPGTLANTQNRPNLRFNRAVELLRPGQATMSPSTPIAPPTSCAPALETAFQAAKTMAFTWIDATRPEVQARPIAGPIAPLLDQFFGNHSPETARRVDHNLPLIRTEIDSLAQAGHHDCADPNLPGCVSAIAFNAGGNMTICAGYDAFTPENQARNLVHEAGHSTAGLRITGARNAPRTSDFAYRRERLIHQLGGVDPEQALSNSDSYAMFLMTRRAAAAVTPNLLPTTDPAAAGFATTADAGKTQRAVALAEVWLRLAGQGLTDLHGKLRGIGTASAVPATMGDPRLNRILAEVKLRFPPVLSGATITNDDLLMIAGILDRYDELERLISQPVAMSPGSATAFTAVAAAAPATSGSLSLTVDTVFLAAGEQARTRSVVDKLIELVAVTRISAAMRPNYGAFAESVRRLFQ